MPSEVHTYELCKITHSHPRYGVISSCISASLKCIFPSHLCITLSQCSMLMTPLTRYHNNTIMGKYHAFVRLMKPYKCYHKPRGAIEYAFKIVLTKCCYQIDPSYRRVCWYSHAIKLLHHIEKCVGTCIRKADKAI